MEKIYKLPKEFAVKWITALRSGDYKQGRGMLYRYGEESYCCIGVAANLCGIDNATLGYNGLIPQSFFKEYQVPNELQHSTALVNQLVNMNDNNLANFTEIANWIENHVEFYEK